MIYKLSPSALKWDFSRCARCAYLKIVLGLRAPSAFFPPLFNRIHGWIYEYMASAHTSEILPDMPSGRLLHVEQSVKSKPIQDTICLHGRMDGLIELDTGGYCVMDIKTTEPEKVNRLAKSYALQLNTYAWCLENPADGAFSATPIERLGILAFMPDRFAARHKDAAGIAGSLRWVDVARDDSVVGKVLGDVLPILRSDSMPASGADCDWCRYVQLRTFQTIPESHLKSGVNECRGYVR